MPVPGLDTEIHYQEEGGQVITKAQAMTEDQFHYGECHRRIGPRGGVTETTEHWRRNGVTQTWKTRPDEWRIPIKFGMRGYSQIHEYNAHEFHLPSDCPLNYPEWEG
jgi:hypothetical protein